MFIFQDEYDSGLEVNDDVANRMSLFYAQPTPMLKVLSDTTTRFVSEVGWLLSLVNNLK